LQKKVLRFQKKIKSLKILKTNSVIPKKFFEIPKLILRFLKKKFES